MIIPCFHRTVFRTWTWPTEIVRKKVAAMIEHDKYIQDIAFSNSRENGEDRERKHVISNA